MQRAKGRGAGGQEMCELGEVGGVQITQVLEGHGRETRYYPQGRGALWRGKAVKVRAVHGEALEGLEQSSDTVRWLF